MRTLLLVTLLVMAFWLLGMTVWGDSLGGELGLELTLLPHLTLDNSFTFFYGLENQRASSFSRFFWGTWVWQEFTGKGNLGPLGWEGHLLFGPSTVDYLYGEIVLSASIAGLDLGFYAAQLSKAVLGGPANGAALRVSGKISEIEIESTTEFGATPEGIEIFHAATGFSRKYTTDPRIPGSCFTGERLKLEGIPLCGELAGTAELYFTKDEGFKKLSFTLSGIKLWGSPPISADIGVEFQTQTKSMSFTPRVEFPGGCLVPYMDVITEKWGMDPTIRGFSVSGLKFEGELGGARLRDLTVLDRCHYAISTPEYGSKIVYRPEADKEGVDYYVDCWELTSLELSRPACCGGEWKLLANTYFGGDNVGLFGWGMSDIDLEFPLGENLTISGRLKVTRTGVDDFSVGVRWSW